MAVPPNADQIANLLLRFYRDPVGSYGDLLHATNVLASLDVVVRLAVGKAVAFERTALGAPDSLRELERAAAHFIQQNLFRSGATHYEVLGLTANASADAVRDNFRLLMQLVHPDRQANDPAWPQRSAAQVNRAHTVLKNPAARAAYDALLAEALNGSGAAQRSPVFPTNAGVFVRARPRMRASVLPEWLTARVGGFVREHPAPAIFILLLSLSASAIVLVLLAERETTLTRDAFAATEPGVAAKRAPGSPPSYLKSLPAPVLTEVARAPADEAPPVTVATAWIAPPFTAPAAAAADANVRERSLPGAEPSSPAARRFVASTVPPVGESLAADAPRPAFAVTTAKSTPVSGSQPHYRDTPTVLASSGRPVPVDRPAAVDATPRLAAPAAMSAVVVPSVLPSAVAAPTSAMPPTPAGNPPPTLLSAVRSAAPSPVDLPGEMPAPSSAEVEGLIAAFISSYESGQGQALAGLFDTDAQANQAHGRAAIRRDYDELFGRSIARRIALNQLRWKSAGEHTNVSGEIGVRTIGRDGREADQRMTLDLQLVRRDGKVVIARLTQQVRN